MHEKVRRVAKAMARVITFILLPLAALGRILLGNVQWQPPAWLAWLKTRLAPLGRWCQDQAAWVALVAVLLTGGVWGALHGPTGGWKNWWDWQTFSGARPDQGQISAAGISVDGPARTPYDGDGKPRPVILKFSVSAAPLARVGKEATDIELAPALPGKWTWSSANQLEFLPNEDWPIGERYTVTLGNKALAPHVTTERQLTFNSPAFEVDIRNAVFYQDPVQVGLRKAVFDVAFSHPVNPDTLEKQLSLQADGDIGEPTKGGVLKFTVTYDKLRLNASVHSDPLPIPLSDVPVTLRIAPGVAAQRGGKGSERGLVKAVAIPGLFSLDITELKQVIVTADNGDPENVLQVTAGMAVHEKEMNRATTAWLLPAKGPNGEEGYAWSDPAEITEAVLKQGARVPLVLLPAEREISEGHAFKFVAEPGRHLLVRIQKGLKSAGGYQLAANRDEILRVKRSAPELSIMSKGALLALSGDKKLPILVRDLSGVRLEIGRLLPQQLQHLVTQSQGEMSRPAFYAGITPDNLTERFEKEIPLTLKSGKTHYETVDFAEYLRADAGDRRGVFLVSVQGYDPQAGKAAAAADFGEGDQQDGEEYAGDDYAGDEWHGRRLACGRPRRGPPGLAVENGSCWQGACGRWLSLYRVGEQKVEPVFDGMLSSGTEGTAGHCSDWLQLRLDQPQRLPGDGYGSAFGCYEIEGNWQVHAAGAPVELRIEFSGARVELEEEEGEEDEPASVVTLRRISQLQIFRFEKGRFALHSGENPNPGL